MGDGCFPGSQNRVMFVWMLVASITGAICVRIYFAFMVMVGVCSTCPILVKNNPKFGVPKLIRLKVICN